MGGIKAGKHVNDLEEWVHGRLATGLEGLVWQPSMLLASIDNIYGPMTLSE